MEKMRIKKVVAKSLKPIDMKDDFTKSYSIYNFLESNPTILIAIVSAMVATITFFINLLSYLISARTLKYWSIDPSLASTSMNDKGIFYLLCLSLIYLIFIFVTTGLVASTYNAYRPFTKYLVYLKLIMSRNNAEIKRYSNKYKNFEKRLRKLPESDEKSSIMEEITLSKQQIYEEKEHNKSMRKNIRKIKKLYKKMLILNLTIIYTLLILANVILIIINSNTSDSFIEQCLPVLTFLVIQIFVFTLLGYISMRLTISKSEISELIDDGDEVILSDISFDEYPLVTIVKRGFTPFFTNSTFCQLILNMFFLIFVYMFVFSMPQNTIKNDEKDFYITSIDSIQYVVVCYDANRLFLEEATIGENKEITVYTSKQRVVQANNVPLDRVTFERVNRVDDST